MDKKIVPISTFEKPIGETAARLTDKVMPCDFVLMQLSNTEGDGSDSFITSDANGNYYESNEEIYWGFDNKPLHQLFPTNLMPFFIPVSDAGDIFVRCSKKKSGLIRKVVFSTFRYEDI